MNQDTHQLSNQAEKSGCVAAVAFDRIYDVSPHSNSDSQLLIPYVYIGKEDGLNLQDRIGSETLIQVDVFDDGCYPSFESNRCNRHRTIIAVAEGRYQCWQAKQFSDIMRFPPNWSNCEVFRALTSICGRGVQGYAGTATELQRAVITWLPRVAAILSSVLVSSIVI